MAADKLRAKSWLASAVQLICSAGLLVGALSLLSLKIVPMTRDTLLPGLAVASEPLASGASGDRPLARLPAARPVRYQLTARLDPLAHTVTGRGNITLENTTPASLTELRLHLYMNAFEHEGTVFRRRRLEGFRGDPSAGNGRIELLGLYSATHGQKLDVPASNAADPNDRTDLSIALPAPLAPGETLRLEVSFVTHLPPVTLRTGYNGSFHMVAQWFPKLAKLAPNGQFVSFPYERLSEFYSDFADYEVSIEVPEAFTVGASGVLSHETLSEGRRTSVFSQQGIGDFAFAAWDGFERREAQLDGTRIILLTPRGHDRSAERQLKAAILGLGYLGERLGPYPYETLTIVSPPPEATEAGGMEYPTLFTTGGPAYSGHLPAYAVEHLVLHELAHQWFYGMLASNENAEPFLDEGLTTYMTGEAVKEIYGRSLSPLVDLSISAVDRAGPAFAASRGPIASPANAFESGYDYGALVYSRTATLLRTLDRSYDGAGMRALEIYARRHRFGHPTQADLAWCVEQAAGSEARVFFEQAIQEPAWVDFTPLPPAALPNGGTRITIERLGTLRAPVSVLVKSRAGDEQLLEFAARDDELSTDVQMSDVSSILVDPEARLLIEERRRNNGYVAQGTSLPPRSAALSLLLANALLTLGAP